MAENEKDRDYLGRLQGLLRRQQADSLAATRLRTDGLCFQDGGQKLLLRLENEGFVERTPDDDAWMPSSRFFERALADSHVPAGMPANGTRPFMLDDYVVKQPSPAR